MVLDEFMYVFAKFSQASMFFFVLFNCVIKFEISLIALLNSVQLHNVTETCTQTISIYIAFQFLD